MFVFLFSSYKRQNAIHNRETGTFGSCIFGGLHGPGSLISGHNSDYPHGRPGNRITFLHPHIQWSGIQRNCVSHLLMSMHPNLNLYIQYNWNANQKHDAQKATDKPIKYLAL